ncbi:MAG: hypothetical protein EOP39_23225 [Rubrivivax sp.]|nr:MAG: hypothetical protein EOP39_23225 [Rubrivivax sp.]
MRALSTMAAAAAASLALVACGGGSEYESHPEPGEVKPTAVPDSAIASSSALVTYLNAQRTDDETGEALMLPAGDAATSETDEPANV